MPKNEKEFFIDLFMSQHDTTAKEAEEAWEQCRLLRDTINIDNVPNFISFINLSKKDRLAWRTKRAEEGTELTPHEVDKYVSLVRYVVETL